MLIQLLVVSLQVEKLVHLSDNTYSEKEIREMERQVIAALKWNFHIPTAINFLDKGFDVVGRNDSVSLSLRLLHSISS